MPILNIETSSISHVELRPIGDFGESWGPVFANDAELFNVYWATAGVPAMWHRSFDKLDEAVNYMLTDRKFVDVRRWFDSNEIMEEFASKEDIVFALSDSEVCEDEDLIEIGEKLGFSPEQTEALLIAHQTRR